MEADFSVQGVVWLKIGVAITVDAVHSSFPSQEKPIYVVSVVLASPMRPVTHPKANSPEPPLSKRM